MNWRNFLFWTLDKIRGKKLLKHYQEIKFCVENPLDSKTTEITSAHLENLLAHASSQVPFYIDQNLLGNSIQSYPVINKIFIKDNFSQLHAKNYLEHNCFEAKTSGSTGTPFMVLQDQRKRLRNTADTIYFSNRVGYKVGYKLIFFRLWKAFEQKGKLSKFIQNVVPIDVFELRKQKNVNSILNQLRSRNKPISLLGYASTFEQICKAAKNSNWDYSKNSIKSAIAISETLSEKTKKDFHSIFGCELISRYSNVENGIIAQQPLGDNHYFIINNASYFIEVLKLDADEPAKDGEAGRIVITDLFNYAMPIIRYDSGDLGIIHQTSMGRVFKTIHGRKVDMIMDSTGTIINTNIMLLINNYPEVNQCQLIQKDKGKYLFKININNDFRREKELVNDFKMYLGEEAIFDVEYVNEIPLLASGKRRVMVNEMIDPNM